MKDIVGKVAVVTGAGSGIGRSLALQLADKGAKLAISDINPQTLSETRDKLEAKGASVYCETFDVGHREAMHQYAENVIAHFGHVDVLVNNAGAALGEISINDVSYEQLEWIIDINLWGVIHGTKAFLPNLLTRPAANIVNISSVFGIIGIPNQGPYCLTKYAVRGWTEALIVETQDTNVRVAVVHPGGIATNIVRNSQGNEEAKEALIKRFDKSMAYTSSNSAAATIIKGIEKDQDKILIGYDAHAIDGAARFLPRRVGQFLINTVLKQLT